MIKVNVVSIGKVKEKYFRDGIDEYAKRLSKYCQFKIIELDEENYSQVSDSLIDKIKKTEAERIKKHLKGYVFALAIEGEKLSSEKFAKTIKTVADKDGGEITFVIGGSYGLDDEIKLKANKLLSFSDMTFPHTMFRLMLAEQIYRAFSILNGSAYHK